MLHTQILIRAEIHRPLLSTARADEFMRAAVAAAGMNIIAGPYSVLGEIPGNEGVSSTVILDFSSASLHEWPGAAPLPLIHFDLYTCGAPPQVERFRALFSDLQPASFRHIVIDRDRILAEEPPPEWALCGSASGCSGSPLR